MSQPKENKNAEAVETDMNKRGNDRIDMQLPCRLLFPNIWPGSLDGYTANLHRTGVLVACKMHPGRELPTIGETANVHIELPPSIDFPPKFISCDTTLLRIDALGESEYQFALQILNVDFADLSPAIIELMKLDPESCDYVM